MDTLNFKSWQPKH